MLWNARVHPIHRSGTADLSEAERLACFLNRDNYLDPVWCSNFAREYPELRNTGIAPNEIE